MSSPTADLHAPSNSGAEDVERRRRLLKQWRRHSAAIAVLRGLLPALCVLILATIAVWAGLNVVNGRSDAVKVSTDSDIRMQSPVVQGRTERGQPYIVRMASATRDNVNSSKMTLDKPVLTLDAGGPMWTIVRANTGVYREDTGMLDLHGAVVLDDYKGNHLVTEHALVDTKKNNVEGDSHISGHGPLGAIDASSYSLRDGGAYLLFKDRVKLRIQSARTTGPATPAPRAGK
jgi:lipopolysaccharide export system protein LptC